MAALPVLSERAALAATLLADRAALAVTAATVGRLMAAVEVMVWLVATAAACWGKPRAEAMAALPVLPERAALVATLLADRAVTAVTAATVGRLMAATRLVALAATDLCSPLAETSPT